MTGSPLQIRDAIPGDEAAVQQVVFPVLREFGLTPDVHGPDVDLEDLQAAYAQRGGVFRVVTDGDGRIVGCGGFRPLSGDAVGENAVELRKMYLLPEWRGRGLGRRLLEDLITRARTAGHRRMVLDTAAVMTDAIALYKRSGFISFENPQRLRRCDLSLSLDLAA